MLSNRAVQEYKNINAESMQDAPPHQIVKMLLEGAINKLSSAKGYFSRHEEFKATCEIRTVRAIIDALKASLDFEKGGEIAQNLDRLYDYMMRRLFEANTQYDMKAVDEVASVLIDIKTGWDGVCEKIAGDPSIISEIN
jgi:flagellar protein FliS